MKPRTLILAAVLMMTSQNYLFSQDKLNIKFGKISAADFDLSKYQIDSGANAVVIADIGSSYFEGNSKGWFSLVHKKQTRVKILNKNGFDAADVYVILYYDKDSREDISNLKAVTYNLENGNVVSTPLEKKSVFQDKLDRNHIAVKFTLPAIKEGSLIEYTYTVRSEFYFNLQPWSFQGKYPVLWSEYEVSIPSIFDFVFLSQGFQKFDISETSNRANNYMIRESGGTGASSAFTFSSNDGIHRWVMKNVPALKEESFTSTIRNHIDKVEFQLATVMIPQQAPEDYLGNWTKLSEKLMKDEDFGESLDKDNNWMNDDVKIILQGASNDLEKMYRIYAWVRDHFTCTDHSARYLSNPLKTVFKNKNGNVADINLLLTAMLRHENLQAYPVILSTRHNGYAHPVYPLINRYNYVICQVVADNRNYYLDATDPDLGFGHLPSDCYNGQARVITPTLAAAVDFIPDSITESKVTSVFLFKEKSPGELSGKFSSTLGYYESLNLRDKVKEKGEQQYFKDLAATNSELELSNIKLDSLKIPEIPIQESYEFKMKNEGEVAYLNPMMGEGYKENWFKAVDRLYPVEMPYTIDETFIFSMEIPEGYEVEEIPKSARVSMTEGKGLFEYLIAKDDQNIRLRSRLQLKKATFSRDDYQELREFFSYVVKKHQEQIVLKKKK
jgi:hypothetical protein